MTCRFCKTPLEHVFVDLGSAPPSNAYMNKQCQHESTYPLKVYVCHHCFLVQIREEKTCHEIFNHHYAYFSSFSKTWLTHAQDYTELITNKLSLTTNSKVLEIASNDGYLLQFFKQKNIPCLGIEPSSHTAQAAQKKGIESITEFFNASFAKKLLQERKHFDLVIGNNVLAHVPDLHTFIQGLKIILHEKGTISIEVPHLLNLLLLHQFDTIYHEHYSYFSLLSLEKIFNYHQLKIYDLDEIPTHGGSLRIYLTHQDNHSKAITPALNVVRKKERKLQLDKLTAYSNFQTKVDHIKTSFVNFLVDNYKANKKVIAYGAAAKGNTLLNYCNIKGSELIKFVVDLSPHTAGKFLPGSQIPIVSEDMIKTTKPDYIIILPWNLSHEIQSQLAYTKDWNSKFIVAIPEMKIF